MYWGVKTDERYVTLNNRENVSFMDSLPNIKQ